MDPIRNFYVPGMGTQLPELISWGALLDRARVTLARVKLGRAFRSFTTVSLRGIDKPVLLSRIRQLANEAGYRVCTIEAHGLLAKGMRLLPGLTSTSRSLWIANKTGLYALIVVSVLQSLVHVAAAREMWPNDLNNFFSTDMRPVKIEFFDDRLDRTREPVRFEIPRAWIAFADGYSPKKSDQVPDSIQTWTLEIWLSEPDGVPMTSRVSKTARSGQVGISTARHSLRAEEYHVSFWKVDPAMTAERWSSRFPKSATIERDGRQYDPHRGVYMPNGTDDAFIEARCNGSTPVAFCGYVVRVSPQLMATMTFLDFRYDRGIDFANARIRRALGVLCRQSQALCMTSSGAAN